ncbi:MAG: LmbE family protein [Spirochaetes bacterium RBG_16_67_19]|nr:MAG: LmbE family protein [Spirochaetes bacterium RBG_16_67_19]
MPTTVFAFSCHPDDIEFMMGGTLFLLKRAGCALHYMNLADGSCGSTELGPAQTAAKRLAEARAAAALLGAEFHEPLAADLEVFYTPELVRRATAVMRRVKPDILLLPSPEDYMEDHMNTSRVGVTAAFCRGMPNFTTLPPEPPIFQDVVLYHALPYGLADGMRRPVNPDFFVDIGPVIEEKQAMLACHQSQRQWLDTSQGLDSYLATMREMSAEVGRRSGRFAFAEGWRRHSHLGFSALERDPLGELLGAAKIA